MFLFHLFLSLLNPCTYTFFKNDISSRPNILLKIFFLILILDGKEVHHVFKLQSLKIDGNYKFSEEVHDCIHIVLKTAIEETGS